MLSIQSNILKTIKEANRIDYFDLINSLAVDYDVNDVHLLLVYFQKIHYIEAEYNLDEHCGGYITLSAAGLIAYYSEVELLKSSKDYEEKLRKQFKITTVIALLSAGAVIGQLVLSIFK